MYFNFSWYFLACIAGVPISDVPEFVFAFPELLLLKKISACVKTSTQQLALSRGRESIFTVVALSCNPVRDYVHMTSGGLEGVDII